MAFQKITESESLYDNLDQMSVRELLEGINNEDRKVAIAVGREIPKIEKLVTRIVERMRRGGRLFYIGAGTSGRLGVLDASEIPPTYGMPNTLVIGLIAGGDRALRNPVESAEDDLDKAWEELQQYHINTNDTLVGIAASGTTPYVIGALRKARSEGILTASISCNPDSPMAAEAEIAIEPVVGPEFVTGSTRMKSGTAQKMVLNMLSTCTMVKLGKVYGNLMVDVKPSNEKLVHRCISIVREATGADEKTAVAALEACGYKCKTAIVMLLCSVSADEAEARLGRSDGRVADAIR